MRLWTVHPKHLDRQALVAVWREALLAQAVLLGKTKGYRHHPQLRRFQALGSPIAGVATYLTAIHAEATVRGYTFDHTKIEPNRMRKKIPETRGQLLYEWSHLLAKVKVRSSEWFLTLRNIEIPEAHPLFCIATGGIQDWEHVSTPS